MVTTNNKELADIIRALRVHGSGNAGWQAYKILHSDNIAAPDCGDNSYDNSESKHHGGNNRNTISESNNDSSTNIPVAGDNGDSCPAVSSGSAASCDSVLDMTKYYNYITGYNSRLDELQAAILLVKLKYLDEWNEKRRETAAYYSSRLQNSKLAAQKAIEGAKGVYHMYVFQSDQRDRIAGRLKRKGISTGIYYPVPLHQQKAYEGLGYPRGSLPVCEYLADRTLAIPVYPELTASQKEYIIESLLEVIE